MTEYILTIGLFDKDTEEQEITTTTAKTMIAEILISKYGIFAYTAFDCSGVYKMQSTGHIIAEPSIRIEIAADDEIPTRDIIADIKAALNQEAVMLKVCKSNINFI